MNKKLLRQLQARHEQRLSDLKGQIESGEVREADLDSINEEIDGLIDELKGIKEELDEVSTDEESSDENNDSENSDTTAATATDTDGEGRSTEVEEENRSGMISQEQRDGLLGSIRNGMKQRSNLNNKKRIQQVRKGFAKYVIGQLNVSEARALGIVTGNGGVTVPKELVPEVISYAQEINPLRTDGSMHPTKSQLGFPVLVKKAKAYGHKKERGTNDPIKDSTIELDEIILSPAEFDALALITKKLIKRSDLAIEDIVMEELGKAYAEQEGIYCFRGDDPENTNDGALSKKAVQVFATKTVDDNGTPKVVAITGENGPEMFDALVDLKNAVKASVRRVSKWYLNDAALSIVEKMKDNEGRPLYSPMDQLKDGIDGKLLNYPVTVTEFADKSADDTDTPIFYFGDPKSFHMQEVEGALETQTLVEKYSDTNHIGIKIYNLLDGQLIYSPLEPTMYKLELGVIPNP